MRVCFEGEIGFFAGRDAVRARMLIISIGMEGVLTVINAKGILRYPSSAGVVTIPVSALAEGENRLLFRRDTVLYHIESLWKEDGAVLPKGTDAMPLLVSLSEDKRVQRERLASLERRVEQLAALTEGCKLFG